MRRDIQIQPTGPCKIARPSHYLRSARHPQELLSSILCPHCEQRPESVSDAFSIGARCSIGDLSVRACVWSTTIRLPSYWRADRWSAWHWRCGPQCHQGALELSSHRLHRSRRPRRGPLEVYHTSSLNCQKSRTFACTLPVAWSGARKGFLSSLGEQARRRDAYRLSDW